MELLSVAARPYLHRYNYDSLNAEEVKLICVINFHTDYGVNDNDNYIIQNSMAASVVTAGHQLRYYLVS
jgi:hypothetical protein